MVGLGGSAGLGDLSVLISGVDSGVLALCGGDSRMLCELDDRPEAVFLISC